MSCILSYLRKLNVFQSDDDNHKDTNQCYNDLIATRAYLIALVLALFTLTLSLSLIPQITKTTIHNPTVAQVRTLPHDIQCPCSRLSVSYNTFVTLEARFHQVCSSDFVSNRWIKAIYSDMETTHFYQGDFRGIGSAQFQVLASLCNLSKINVEDGLYSFYHTSLISSQVISEDLLKATIEVSIEHFNTTVPLQFKSQLDLTNKLIFGNQLLSGLRTTLNLEYRNSNESEIIANYLDYKISNITGNRCVIDYNIGVPSGFYNVSDDEAIFIDSDDSTKIVFHIPGLVSGCMPTHSLLLSTLECFYDQTCVNQILSYLSTNETFTAMTTTNQTLFPSKLPIQSIVNRIMVEQWISNISYEQYFTQCAPLSCTYSKAERHDFIFVLTDMIGLLGGLTLVLGIIIPVIVRYIRKPKMEQKESIPNLPLSIRMDQSKLYVKRQLLELNLFRSRFIDDRHVSHQRIGTRFYIFVLIISLGTLTLYSLIIQDINRQTIFDPSESQYNELHRIYPTNLICPCTSLSISHQTFLSIEPVYDQICFSEFLSSTWINYFLENKIEYLVTTDSIRTNLGTQFNILRTLCQYSEQMMNDAVIVFLQAQFVSSQVIPEPIFRLQIDILIEQWQMDILNRCRRVIDLVRAMNQGNKFISDYQNFKLQINKTLGQVNFVPIQYSNCSCALDQTCSLPIFIGPSSNVSFVDSENMTNSNLFVGCSALEALLQGTLKCFYNRTCIDYLLTIQTTNGSGYQHLINISTLTMINNQSNDNFEKIESIVDRVMINKLVSNISFSSYYNVCRPSVCTIEQMGRRQTFVIITIVISVLGGLSTGLKIFFLIGMKFWEQINDRHGGHGLLKFVTKLVKCTNEHQMTSRLQIILLLVFMLTFYLISFLPPQTNTIQITLPTFATYQDLFTSTDEPIQCSCSQISFNYQSFLTVKPRFHQICSSHFVSNQWIKYVYENNHLYSSLNSTDFRLTSVGQFQLFNSFCQLSQRTVNESLFQLLLTAYIDAQLVPSNILTNKIQTTLKEFQLSTSKSFLTTFNLLREVTEANQLISGYGTNWKFNHLDRNQSNSFLYLTALDYDECNCGLSSKCTRTSRGMRVGCYPIEALLQTTLQCFYDQSCIDINHIFQALNSSDVASRFDSNSTIEFISQELMLEEYTIDMVYEKYFNQCAPSFCTYSYSGHRNIIETITSLIGLYGGLVIVSRWITMLIVELYKCRLRQIHPETP